jgi:hypothetical protein
MSPVPGKFHKGSPEFFLQSSPSRGAELFSRSIHMLDV